MNVIEYIDRFARTMFAFWRLHPRDFIANARREDSGYSPLPEFLAVFLTIGIAIYSAYFSLVFLAVQRESGAASEPPARALALRMLLLIIVIVVVNTLYNRSISRVWPLRGSATFREILDFRLYQLSTLFPFMVLDLLVVPPLMELRSRGLVPESSVSVPLLAGLALGIILDIVKGVPGLAALNRVSTARTWAGLLFWPMIVAVVVGVVGGVVAALVLG